MSRSATFASLALNVVLLAMLVVSSITAAAPYVVSVPEGMVTRMNASDAAATALDQIGLMQSQAADQGLAASKAASIKHVVAATGAELINIEPRAAGFEDDRICG